MHGTVTDLIMHGYSIIGKSEKKKTTTLIILREYFPRSKISQDFPRIPKISQDFPRFPKISQANRKQQPFDNFVEIKRISRFPKISQDPYEHHHKNYGNKTTVRASLAPTTIIIDLVLTRNEDDPKIHLTSN